MALGRWVTSELFGPMEDGLPNGCWGKTAGCISEGVLVGTSHWFSASDSVSETTCSRHCRSISGPVGSAVSSQMTWSTINGKKLNLESSHTIYDCLILPCDRHRKDLHSAPGDEVCWLLSSEKFKIFIFHLNELSTGITWCPLRLRVDSADGGPMTDERWDCGTTGGSTLGSSADKSPVEPRVPRGSLLSPLDELVDPDLRRSLLHHFHSGWALKWASLT